MAEGLGSLRAYYEAPPAGCFREEVENGATNTLVDWI